MITATVTKTPTTQSPIIGMMPISTANGHPKPPVKEPPSPPNEPPIEEPEKPPQGPFPPQRPPIEIPPDAPQESPVREPPPEDPNRKPLHPPQRRVVSRHTAIPVSWRLCCHGRRIRRTAQVSAMFGNWKPWTVRSRDWRQPAGLPH